MNLSEKLKSLRKEKNVSQEKLANYLNVSFQAVSKWENANTYPDISLLPDIARFYGITGFLHFHLHNLMLFRAKNLKIREKSLFNYGKIVLKSFLKYILTSC